MKKSFQNEIPKARINMSLNVETGGHSKKVDLPLKMLVMGDFSNSKTKGKIEERERININKNNFESVMQELTPSTRFDVPNKISNDDSDLAVELKFSSLKDFRPDNVAQQIPELHSLIGDA